MIVLKCHTYRSAAKLLYTGWKVVWDKWPCDFWINVNCGDGVLCFYCILAEREEGGCTYWVSFLHLHACLFMCWGWPNDLSCYIWLCVIAFEYQTMTTQRYCLYCLYFEYRPPILKQRLKTIRLLQRTLISKRVKFGTKSAHFGKKSIIDDIASTSAILMHFQKNSKIKFCMARTNIFFKILKIITYFENESISLNVYRRF